MDRPRCCFRTSAQTSPFKPFKIPQVSKAIFKTGKKKKKRKGRRQKRKQKSGGNLLSALRLKGKFCLTSKMKLQENRGEVRG